MPLQLDHTIVPAYDKVKAAEFIARIFGLKYDGPWGHFAPVKVNDILTLDFDDSDNPRSNHYAFLASGRGVRRDPASASRTRVSPTGAVHVRGQMARSTTCTRGAGSTSNAKTVTSGRLSPTHTSPSDTGCHDSANSPQPTWRPAPSRKRYGLKSNQARPWRRSNLPGSAGSSGSGNPTPMVRPHHRPHHPGPDGAVFLNHPGLPLTARTPTDNPAHRSLVRQAQHPLSWTPSPWYDATCGWRRDSFSTSLQHARLCTKAR